MRGEYLTAPKLRYRVKAGRALTVVEGGGFRDSLDIGDGLRKLAEQADRGEITGLAYATYAPGGRVSTAWGMGYPVNEHALIGACMTLIRRLQDAFVDGV